MKKNSELMNEMLFQYCNLQYDKGLFHYADTDDPNNNQFGWQSIATDIPKRFAVLFTEHYYAMEIGPPTAGEMRELFYKWLEAED